MHKTLSELREIAAAIGYQILESAEAPDSFYLLKRVDADSCVIARIDVDVPSRAKYSLRELADAIGLAIEEFVASLISSVQKNYLDVSEVRPDERLTDVANTAEKQDSGEHRLTKRSALELARELHELAMSLCRTPNKLEDNIEQ